MISGYQTEVFVESTAQGVGGLFHDTFWDAYGGRSGFRAAFFPWFIYSHYQRAFKRNYDRVKLETLLGTDPRYGGEEEKNLLGYSTEYNIGEEGSPPLRFEVTLEHLNWRRHYIDTQFQGDLLKFHQEFPSHPREAFVSTGRSVFAQDRLNEMLLDSEKRYRSKPPRLFNIPVKEFNFKDGKKYLLEPDPDKGELEIFTEPKPRQEYRIGVDVSEGLDIGRDTDWSVATVLDGESYNQVALLRTKTDPDLLAWKLKTLGRYYNDALILCERNNHGLVTLKYLVDVHSYPNVYSEKVLDERSNRSARKIGFHTTVKSKPLIIDFLRKLIREDQIQVHSQKLIDE